VVSLALVSVPGLLIISVVLALVGTVVVDVSVVLALVSVVLALVSVVSIVVFSVILLAEDVGDVELTLLGDKLLSNDPINKYIN